MAPSNSARWKKRQKRRRAESAAAATCAGKRHGQIVVRRMIKSASRASVSRLERFLIQWN